MTDGIQLSQRSHFYALLDSAIASGSPCVHAPPTYTSDRGLVRDILEYVEDNRTVANGWWCYQEHGTGRFVIADGKGTVLVIERVEQKDAA